MHDDLKIYFAGKIEKNDWRNDICMGKLRGIEPLEIEYIKTICGNKYVGPWFISCDHGCYHGDTQHGMLNNGCGFTPASEDRRNFVKEICLSCIDKCDILFAWIDSENCFGTIAEIGYAYANKKKIWLAYSKAFMHSFLKIKPTMLTVREGVIIGDVNKEEIIETPTHEMWFVDQMAERILLSGSPIDAYKCFSDMSS